MLRAGTLAYCIVSVNLFVGGSMPICPEEPPAEAPTALFVIDLVRNRGYPPNMLLSFTFWLTL